MNTNNLVEKPWDLGVDNNRLSPVSFKQVQKVMDQRFDKTCPNNPKKFLWFKWQGKHNFVTSTESTIIWLPEEDEYEMTGSCRFCGRKGWVIEIPESELIDAGLLPEKGES